jgi:phospholipase D1/2
MAKNKILTKDFGKNMSRLMDILDYKAREGVKIFILLYYDYYFLRLNSKYAQNIFRKLNKNINLIRFPKDSNNKLWSNHEKLVIIDDVIGYVGGHNLCWGSYDNNKHPIYEEENEEQIYEFPFKDYDNQRIAVEDAGIDYTKRNKIRFKEPRLPWHDVHARIDGPAIEDFSNHFIDRWNYAVSCESNYKGIIPYLKDVLELNIFENLNQYLNNNKEENKFLQRDHKDRIENRYKKDISDVQALRSISNWSIGLEKTETSILKAYYELIENSKHYIFIENQYFISKSYTDEEININENSKYALVKNEISLYLRRRIEKAYENNENFKVFVFIPLVSALPGEIDVNLGSQLILRHMYKTINRNNGLSLIELLEKKMGDKWKNYIHFFSLRNHGIIKNIPKTEIIYIHSKLLIVDDTKVLISSANLNDRSMLGDRDSEFGVIIEEEKHGKYKMNGDKNYKAAKDAVELRKKLMAEHLGIDENDTILEDPVDNKLFEFMISRAKNNTQIYHDIFKCYPDDEYTTFNLIPKAGNINNEWNDVLLNKYMRKKDQIVGHIVEFPLNFLKDDKLGKIMDKKTF